MQSENTEVLGLVIHSGEPVFLTLVGLHVIAGIAAVIAGLAAMFSRKVKGAHPIWGTAYFWAIVSIVGAAAILTMLRGPDDWPVLALGVGALACAWVGRSARRGRWNNSIRVHIAGMGLSYVLALTAFYVETGDQLPLWRALPHLLYWILPASLGLPLIVRALMRHSPVRRSG